MKTDYYEIEEDLDNIRNQASDIEWNGAYWYSKEEFLKIIDRVIKNTKNFDDLELVIEDLQDELRDSEQEIEDKENLVRDLENTVDTLEEKIEKLEEEILILKNDKS